MIKSYKIIKCLKLNQYGLQTCFSFLSPFVDAGDPSEESVDLRRFEPDEVVD